MKKLHKVAPSSFVKIAITGVLGAGKSTVGQILARQGWPFISADDLNRQAIAPNGPAFQPLLKLLGPKYLNEQGFFDTKKIAQKAFSEKKLLQAIEDRTHPLIYDLLKEQEKKWIFSKKKLFFYEIPLLFEKKWEPLFAKKVVVAIDRRTQIQRLQQNRSLSLKDIENREQFQLTQAEKIKKADYVIWNQGSLRELEQKITPFLSQMKS